MRKRISILIGTLIIGATLSAQEGWSLQQCIDYAMEHNLALKRQEIVRDQAKYDLTEQRMRQLPNLNFSTNASLNYGRSVDPRTNTYTFDPNFSNSYSLSSGMTIFRGFAQTNMVAATKLMYLMGIEMVELQKNQLSLDIVNAYYQLLMTRGLAESARQQMLVTEKQLKRSELMVQTGKESRTTYYELQGQLSSNKLLLTQAENDAVSALQNLKALLQLGPDSEFDIQSNDEIIMAEADNMSPDSLYYIAKGVLPGIKALEYKTKAMEKGFTASKGYLVPAFSLSAGLSSAYIDALQEGINPTPFSEQLSNNNNYYFGVSFSLPIFNRWATQRSVKRAKLNLADSKLELEQEYNTLYQEVTRATLDLMASQDEYLAARDNLEYSRISFDSMEKKMATGLANATEFAESRRQLFSAEVNLIRSQLQYNLKMMTIKFFLSGTWNE